MIENNNYPWYLQHTDTFSKLYYGFFPIAEYASPLTFGEAFDVDKMTGKMLYTLGTYWGLSGASTAWAGLIYDIDNWSETKHWTGWLRDIGEDMYRNLIKAKAYANGRVYSLNTLKEVINLTLAGVPHSVTIDESDMEITINLTAAGDVIQTFIEMRAFDLSSIGKPVGIKVNWAYSSLD